MPIILPQKFIDEGERPQGTNPWLWLLEIELAKGRAGIPPVILRSTSGEEELQWPLSDPDLTTWYPFPFSFSPIEQTQEGDLPQLSVAIDNSGRFLMRYMHESDGLEGNRVDLFLVPKDSTSLAYPNHQFQHWRLQVAEVSANDEAISLRLERPNFLQRNSPQDRYIPNRCRWPYGSTFCGYVLNGLAAFPTCPKTIGACIDRGEDMVARGFGPNVLPANYGGHPGVSVQR